MGKAIAEALAVYAPAGIESARFAAAALVAEQRPGQETSYQQRQSARLLGLRRRLEQWANQHSLPLAHVEQAAYFTVVSTRPDESHLQAVALAETIFWIYAFDDYLDQHPVTSSLVEIDRELSRVLAPLRGQVEELGTGTRRHWRSPAASLLGELMPATSWARARSSQAPDSPGGDRVVLVSGLGEALYSLLSSLDELWAQAPERRPAGVRYRRRLVASQLARCVASMRREYGWNLQLTGYRSQQTQLVAGLDDWLPALSLYLLNGAVSIGMYAVAAVVASFESSAGRAWHDGLASIDAAGRIIRLANDLATYPRELTEGKLSLVTLLLGERGDLPGSYSHDGDLLGEAAAVIRESIEQWTDFFVYTSSRLPAGSALRFYLEHVVASALVAYGHETS